MYKVPNTLFYIDKCVDKNMISYYAVNKDSVSFSAHFDRQNNRKKTFFEVS